MFNILKGGECDLNVISKRAKVDIGTGDVEHVGGVPITFKFDRGQMRQVGAIKVEDVQTVVAIKDPYKN